MRTQRKTPRTNGNSPFYKKRLPGVDVWTDGSASHTSKYGGWAYLILFEDGWEETGSGGVSNVTNNAMELEAAIQAMSRFRSPKVVNLYSDSAYLVNTLELGWWREWEARGYMNRSGRQTPNKDRWLRLIDLSRIHVINPIKVKAHSGNINNEACDKMAKRARKAIQQGVPIDSIKEPNRVSKRKSRPYTLSLQEGKDE